MYVFKTCPIVTCPVSVSSCSVNLRATAGCFSHLYPGLPTGMPSSTESRPLHSRTSGRGQWLSDQWRWRALRWMCTFYKSTGGLGQQRLDPDSHWHQAEECGGVLFSFFLSFLFCFLRKYLKRKTNNFLKFNIFFFDRNCPRRLFQAQDCVTPAVDGQCPSVHWDAALIVLTMVLGANSEKAPSRLPGRLVTFLL